MLEQCFCLHISQVFSSKSSMAMEVRYLRKIIECHMFYYKYLIFRLEVNDESISKVTLFLFTDIRTISKYFLFWIYYYHNFFLICFFFFLVFKSPSASESQCFMKKYTFLLNYIRDHSAYIVVLRYTSHKMSLKKREQIHNINTIQHSLH